MRRFQNLAALASACLFVLMIATSVHAQSQSNPSPGSSAMSPPSSAADNTQMNQRDRSGQTATPTSQQNDRADIKLAAAVRRAIVKNKALSTSAHNVKIIAAQGAVTLRGLVKNEDEKSQVEATVKGVAGVDSVNNELDVKH